MNYDALEIFYPNQLKNKEHYINYKRKTRHLIDIKDNKVLVNEYNKITK